MFLWQVVEDFEFGDLVDMYEHDRYFTYIKRGYELDERDELNFGRLLKGIDGRGEDRRYSLEVLTLKKDGIYPRVYLIDHEEELRGIDGYSLEDLLTFPVDMSYTKDIRERLIILIVLLLEHSHYEDLESSLVDG